MNDYFAIQVKKCREKQAKSAVFKSHLMKHRKILIINHIDTSNSPKN